MDSEKRICCNVNIDILDIANIEIWMPIVLQEHFPNLQLAQAISNPFRLHYNVLVLIEVKESQEDSYYYVIKSLA